MIWWPDSSVRRILRNPLYTGTMVQGKNRMKSYKLHISEAVPEDEWITVAQTHEAIIPIELFDKAQALFGARYAHRTNAAQSLPVLRLSSLRRLRQGNEPKADFPAASRLLLLYLLDV